MKHRKKVNEVKAAPVRTQSQVKRQRIGIYSGTFDPVHAGHIAFALQAAETARLDRIYFLPERRPRGKQQVTHYAHRVAMIRRAVRPYPQLGVLELEDKNFSVPRTLPRIERRFPGAELVFVCGSDVLGCMTVWPGVERLLERVELCIGGRYQEDVENIAIQLVRLPKQPIASTVVKSYAAAVSSSQIREALRAKRSVRGLLASVRDYATREWLYL